ncbi:MAG: 3-phosphoshikimate 1-carboxyvinyltransferase, partial [Ruminococcus sp.]|nr:3-phosphoshikimate 1-carboxyvinyltransferase [Ruminococcus sp.]
RIAMAMAIAATRCEQPITIHGAECVAKSYPDFWEVYESLGGEIERS